MLKIAILFASMLMPVLAGAADSYLQNIKLDSQETMNVKLLDNGDGTYSLQSAAVIQAGNAIQTSTVATSTASAAVLFAASTSTTSGQLFNNSAYTLWVGSSSVVSWLYSNGYPVISSGTFNMASNSAALRGALDSSAGSATGDARTIRGTR